MKPWTTLYSRLGDIAGTETRDAIFGLIPEITPGTAADVKAGAMRTVIGKAMEILDQNQKDELFMTSFRDLDNNEYEKDRCLFLECGGVDAFIDAKKKQFLEELRHSHASQEALLRPGNNPGRNQICGR
ncbi:MAG: hypothetical protein MZU97_27140 [Bacillus subtilis]|nr:hypothetical protein [Bacillus subtilis]